MKGDSRTDKQKKITWSKQKLYEDMRVTPHPCQINNNKNDNDYSHRDNNRYCNVETRLELFEKRKISERKEEPYREYTT